MQRHLSLDSNVVHVFRVLGAVPCGDVLGSEVRLTFRHVEKDKTSHRGGVAPRVETLKPPPEEPTSRSGAGTSAAARSTCRSRAASSRFRSGQEQDRSCRGPPGRTCIHGCVRRAPRPWENSRSGRSQRRRFRRRERRSAIRRPSRRWRALAHRLRDSSPRRRGLQAGRPPLLSSYPRLALPTCFRGLLIGLSVVTAAAGCGNESPRRDCDDAPDSRDLISVRPRHRMPFVFGAMAHPPFHPASPCKPQSLHGGGRAQRRARGAVVRSPGLLGRVRPGKPEAPD